uniref:MICOS complex subunit MIC13 n=1 Tax=Elaeophora elaphi TaxID=1147741 RepID=A0A0R3RWG4_9BILA
MALFRRLVRTGIKAGVVVAVVKVSYHLDIWSLDSDQGAQKLTILKETVVPGTIVFPKEFMRLALFPFAVVTMAGKLFLDQCKME